MLYKIFYDGKIHDYKNKFAFEQAKAELSKQRKTFASVTEIPIDDVINYNEALKGVNNGN